jgi:hypothetical protein
LLKIRDDEEEDIITGIVEISGTSNISGNI